ncbi:MAG: adenylosuccinate lyase [Bacteroidales bacterium]|nr:adenylosuccinate lyase [Bacteroidales bacterium]MCF8404659.1 adenylosuccinate lyase [Bacteroidales bacterium]
MNLTTVNAISPIDGRYRKKVEGLSYYFSEAGLINYRVYVEVEYFISLVELGLPQLKDFDTSKIEDLRAICRDFTFIQAEEVKKIEKTTNHDVKAIEYYLKKEFEKLGLGKYKEFIHFGLTSQDITNTAQPYAFKLAFEDSLMPQLNKVVNKLSNLAKQWKSVPMLAYTHGQPASPTFLGKEINVFAERLKHQIKLLKLLPFTAKFGGATGNLNAHYAAYPGIDWIEFSNSFLKKLGLQRQKLTTQIENYDYMATFFDNLKRINTILIDLNRDIWAYVSMNYFKQQIKKGETGSSTMPHKVNPIDFENSEGNLGIANALFEHLSAKLPVSRLQRDLTDSTVSRNIGVPVAHSLLAYKMLIQGLDKLLLNEEKLSEDLENNWAVVAEAIQTILRREGYPKPYEKLKDLTRTNTTIDKKSIQDFIKKLKISEEVKKEMLAITPHNYTGKAI